MPKPTSKTPLFRTSEKVTMVVVSVGLIVTILASAAVAQPQAAELVKTIIE